MESKEKKYNKQEFVSMLMNKMEISKREAVFAVEVFLAGLEEVFEEKSSVSFHGFGQFGIKETPERKGTNPRTQEPMMYKGFTKPYFKPSNTWKKDM